MDSGIGRAAAGTKRATWSILPVPKTVTFTAPAPWALASNACALRGMKMQERKKLVGGRSGGGEEIAFLSGDGMKGT